MGAIKITIKTTIPLNLLIYVTELRFSSCFSFLSWHSKKYNAMQTIKQSIELIIYILKKYMYSFKLFDS